MTDPTGPSAPARQETGPVEVAVAVPTFQRPAQLDRLLGEIAERLEREDTTGFEIRVLVIDNDSDGTARRIVQSHTALDVSYVVESTPGVVAVRNRAIDELVDARLLIFIDDDELPDEHWIGPLLTAWSDTGAALVSGRVRVEYDSDDPFFAAGGFFVRRSMPTGTPITVASTNTVLLDLDVIRDLDLRFDPAFGLSGGEDTRFTRQLARRGALMVWCDESVVIDAVPAHRLTREWVLERARSHGNSSGLVRLHELDGWRRTVRRAEVGLGGAGRWCVGVLGATTGRMTGSIGRTARGARLAARGAGMVQAARGRVIEEYQRS